MSEQLYSRGRDAARAARKHGLKDGEFEIVTMGSRYGWSKLQPPPPPEPEPPKFSSENTSSASSVKSPKNGATENRAARFSFVDIGLTIGTVIISTLLEGANAEVMGDRHILFRGEKHTLSSAALLLAHETGRKWPRIQGPVYWTYQSRKLSDLLKEVR